MTMRKRVPSLKHYEIDCTDGDSFLVCLFSVCLKKAVTQHNIESIVFHPLDSVAFRFANGNAMREMEREQEIFGTCGAKAINNSDRPNSVIQIN